MTSLVELTKSVVPEIQNFINFSINFNAWEVVFSQSINPSLKFRAVYRTAKDSKNINSEIFVCIKNSDNNVEIPIKDKGSGIPAEIKDKIFQPFFTTKPTGSGTGLGLSLSYDIVKAHGGELMVESQEGTGSEFFIHVAANKTEKP